MSSESEEIAQFRPIDLPFISINSDFVSSDVSDLEQSTGSSTPCTPSTPGTPITPATPSTPITPGTPVSQMTSSVTSFGFSEAEITTFSVPLPKRGRKQRGGFLKGDANYKRRLFTLDSPPPPPPPPPPSKKPSLSYKTRFNFRKPSRPRPKNITLRKGSQTSSSAMYVPHGSEVMNMDILCSVVSLIRCNDPSCSGYLTLHKLQRNKGLQSFFILHCARCHNVVAEFPSSLHIGESPLEAVNNPPTKAFRPTEVNTRALLAVHSTSMSWRDFQLVCAVMDLPLPARNLNKRSLEYFKSSTAEVTQSSMSYAASTVRQRESAVESNIPGAFKCDVSFDATWHRRGHYSNQGFGAAIDVVTNKVLDYMLYQRVCNKCSSWPQERQSNHPDEYAAFMFEHKSTCPANFSGTSQGMEGAAAVEIWRRSVDKNKLVYSTYVGDGDSSSFKNLLNSNPYKGIETVRKEECLGHVQKRLKKHLKKKSNSFPKLAAGKIERVGQLYALVVSQNRGKTPAQIQKALWNLLDHLLEKHDNCPSSTESWCYFQKALAENAEDPTVTLPLLRQPYLTDAEYGRAQEVFASFASLNMCGALTMGQTQNANESLHSMIWHNSPKTKHVGQKSIEASTALAVCTFNDGEMALASVLDAMSIVPSYNTLLHLTRRDHARNMNRERAIFETQKRRRRQLTARAITAASSRKRRAKTGPGSSLKSGPSSSHKSGPVSSYKSGRFGTELDPEDNSGNESDTTCEICTKRVCPLGRKRRVDEWIGCEICEGWFHSKCVGVSSKTLGDDAYFCEACD